MKTTLTLIAILLALISNAQQSSLTIFGPGTAFCTADVTYNVTASNVDVSNNPLPLTNTSVLLEIWKETQDPSVDIAFHTILVDGPDIAVNDFHVFKMIIPKGTFDGDGTYTLIFTFFADADKNENPISPEFDLKLSFCGIGFEEARDTLKGYINENVSLSEDQVSYINMEKVSKGSIIKSWNHVELEIEINSDSYVGFVASDPYSEFGQPSKLITISKFPVSISEYDLSFWPVIDDVDWNPIPNETELFGFEFPEEGDEPVEFEEIEQIENPKTCAIIISGKDGNPIKDELYQKQAELFKRNLMNNPYGPRLPEEQIVIAHQAGKDSILTLITELNTNYDKIIFHYTGHGSKTGKMCTGDNSNEWLPYSDFVNAMYNTEAKDFCFFVGCCYSGQLIETVQNDSRSCQKNIDLVTSANSDKPSKFIHWKNPQQEIFKGYSIFNHHFNICSSDINADVSDDGIINYQETFDWIKLVNPTLPGDGNSIFVDQCPQIYTTQSADCGITMEEVRNIIQVSSDDPENDLGEEQNVTVYPARLEAGTKIESFNTEEFSITLNKPMYFGWSVSNPYNDFEQPCKLFLVDPDTEEVESHDLSWWLQINGQSWVPSFFGSESLNPITPIEDLPELPVLDIINPFENPRTCALLINGTDPTFLRTFVYQQDVEKFKENLQHNPFGPRLDESQIITRSGISKDSIQKLIKELETGYDIIYFYYRGHGTKNGQMATGDDPSEFYPYSEFAEDILSTRAVDLKIMIDCCYSGNAIIALNNNPNSCFKDVDISTSARFDKQSRTIYKGIGGDFEGYGIHSYNFANCYRNSATDKNGDGENSFHETSEWIESQDPVDPTGKKPSVYQCPQKFERTFGRSLFNGEFLEFLQSEVGFETVNLSDIYVDVKNLESGTVESLPDFSIEKPNNSGTVIIDNDAYEFYPKGFIVGFLLFGDECTDPSLDFHEVNEGGVPTMKTDEEEKDIPKTADVINFSNAEVLPLEGDVIVIEEYEVLPPEEKRGAMIIENKIPRFQTIEDDNFTLALIKEKFEKEKHGPLVLDKHIKAYNLYSTFNSPSKEDICEALEEAKGRYCHYYFYFSGNGSGTGGINFGLGKGILSYTELFNKLEDIDADTITIILDSGTKSQWIDFAFQNSKLSNHGQVYLQTGGTSESDGSISYSIEGDYYIGSLSGNMFSKLGDLAYDKNDDGETEFLETYIGYRQENFGANLEYGVLKSTKTSNDNEDFTDFTNLNLFVEPNIDLAVTQTFLFGHNLEPTFTDYSEKQTSIGIEDGFLFRDNIEGQAVFKVDPILDYIESQEGILGLAYRKNESSEWEFLQNVIHNIELNTLTTDTIELCGDFVIARIDEMSSSVSEINSSNIELSAYPSIFSDLLSVRFSLNETSNIRFNLVNMEGKIVKSIQEKAYYQGQHERKWNLSELPQGNYILQLIENGSKSKLIMVIKS